MNRPSRHLDIDGCFNVRDAGGWPTSDGRWMRTGGLYRADDPVRITPAGREAIDALGLEAVVDLRSPGLETPGEGYIDPASTYYLPLPEFEVDPENPPRLEEPSDLEPFYDSVVTRGAEHLVRAVDAVAAHILDGPVLVHCSLGKDRTGLVVAVIQAAVGVAPESIAQEYALSHEPTRRRRQEMAANPLAGEWDAVNSGPDLLWTAPAEAMELFVRRGIEQHGSLEGWALGLGVSEDAISRLRAALLVDRPDDAYDAVS